MSTSSKPTCFDSFPDDEPILGSTLKNVFATLVSKACISGCPLRDMMRLYQVHPRAAPLWERAGG